MRAEPEDAGKHAPGEGRPARTLRRCTYRLQLHSGFDFDRVADVSGYLAELGVSHAYLSPVLQAARGSTHGYDVVDPTRVNEELGGEAGHARLQKALGRAGLGQLLDVVPNHMAIGGRENAWWWDVLENGPSSVYASYFDVDWDPPESKLRNVVLLPILGDHYGRELEAGRLRIEREGSSFVLRYFDHVAPIAPRSLDTLLACAARLMSSEADPTGDDAPNPIAELESIATAFGRLPISTRTDPESVRERHRDKEILRVRLGELCVAAPEVARALDRAIEELNADPDQLDALLERQNYRLAWWRTAGEELDYRRFFDINDLAAIRAEDPEVFAESHGLVTGWLAEGVIDGVRVDHVDGLRDPGRYLDRLAAASPAAWVVVEKILEGDEELPKQWPVAGTTGYDWLNLVGDLFVDEEGWRQLTASYREFSGVNERYEEIVHAAKLAVLDGPLAADLNRLAGRLSAICERHRRYRDYTRRDLRDCLGEVAAGFAVYRTYFVPGRPPRAEDASVVEAAVLSAGVRRPEFDEELLGFVRDLLTLRVPGGEEAELALRFQQLTGAVMAKAVEDTAFYRYFPLASLNEVGGDPGKLHSDLEGFHASLTERQRHAPEGLLTLSTHDTKRSEDVRARLTVLSEMPEEWKAAVFRWRDLADELQSGPPLDRNTAWLLYQTLVGAWPIDADRMQAYMEKATREAKAHTSWTDPDPFYDESVRSRVADVFANGALCSEIAAFAARLRRPGWAVSLAQKLLTLTAPGVPDIYQGSECWDLSLVDPDNRRPVDYSKREALVRTASMTDLTDAWAREEGQGLAKILVVTRALSLRKERPYCFGPGAAGAYEPLRAKGPLQHCLVAFCRGGEVVAVAARYPLAVERAGGWRGTTITLPRGRWGGRLVQGTWEGVVEVDELLGGTPVALLAKEGASDA